jgi:transposase
VVLLLHESPDLSNVAARALVELHANSVHRWRHRWARGDFSLADQAGRGRKPAFSPSRDWTIVKAIACEAVCQTKLPLSRLSTSDLAYKASTALGRSISPSTVWRVLDTGAIKPWRYQYWIFPRAPKFSEKAGRVLELYAGSCEDKPLGCRDYIVSSDEKPSIQARIRCHATLPIGSGRPMRVEHEYKRGGALQYLAAWDVRRG